MKFKGFTSLFWIPVFNAVTRGYLFMVFWNWFVVPTFTGAPHLNFSSSFWLLVLFYFVFKFTFKVEVSTTKKERVVKEDTRTPEEKRAQVQEAIAKAKDTVRSAWATAVLSPIVIFVFGWVVHFFYK